MPKQVEEYSSKEIAHVVVQAAIEKKAIEPIAIDVRGACDYADFLVVCSGQSDRQVSGIATGIDAELVEHRSCVGNEGLANGQWVLLDYGDIVVHIFTGSKRLEYNIEGLWKDAPRLDIDIPKELRRSEIDEDSNVDD